MIEGHSVLVRLMRLVGNTVYAPISAITIVLSAVTTAHTMLIPSHGAVSILLLKKHVLIALVCNAILDQHLGRLRSDTPLTQQLYLATGSFVYNFTENR